MEEYSEVITLGFQTCLYLGLIIAGLLAISSLLYYQGFYNGMPLYGASISAYHVIALFLILEAVLVMGLAKHVPLLLRYYRRT